MEVVKNSENYITVCGHDYIAIEGLTCVGCAFHHSELCTGEFMASKIYCGRHKRFDDRSIIWVPARNVKQSITTKLYNKQKPHYSLNFKIK